MINQVATHEYDILNRAVSQFNENGKIDLRCPRCGKPLVYEVIGAIEIVRCQDAQCIKSIRRGI